MADDQKNSEEPEHHAKVISFINMKGGVGKTTLTKEIGFHLSSSLHKQVLLIDVDPQINLTQSIFKVFNYAQSEEIARKIEESKKDESNIESVSDEPLKISTASIQNVFNGSVSKPSDVDKAILNLPNSSLDIIPGELGLEFITRNLSGNQLENGIYNFIDKYGLRGDYDYILIDCPPTYSSYTVAALKPSDYYVIPVKPEAYSILGIDMLQNVVSVIVDDNKPYFKEKPLRNLGVILTDIKKSVPTGTQNLIDDVKTSSVLKKNNIAVFDTTFLHNQSLQNDIGYLIDNSKAEKYSKPNLNKLTSEFIERIKN